jgi:hypothetical protein
MKITVRQLKQLIREATEEAVEEMHGGMMHEEEDDKPEEGMYEEGMHEKEEAVMMEAVKAAYRAGLRKGRSTRR